MHSQRESPPILKRLDCGDNFKHWIAHGRQAVTPIRRGEQFRFDHARPIAKSQKLHRFARDLVVNPLFNHIDVRQGAASDFQASPIENECLECQVVQVNVLHARPGFNFENVPLIRRSSVLAQLQCQETSPSDDPQAALDNSTGAVAELHKICIDLFICLQLAASACNSLPFLIKVISLRKGLILLGSSALSRPCGEVAEWLKATVC